MTRKRIAVVGVGRMGLRHAEALVSLQRAGRPVALAGLVDVAPDRLTQRVRHFDVPGDVSLRALAADLDAVVVAAPTVDHHALTLEAIELGLDVLVEKPFTGTLEEAQAVADAAERRDRVVRVGHQEWWNPALRAVRDEIGRLRYAEVHRLGGLPDRSSDVDVVRDLMIHDIEIVQHLVGGEPTRVEAVGTAVLTDDIDLANARLVFPDGGVANLTASRVASEPARRMRWLQDDGFLSLDFLAGRAEITRRRADGDVPVLVTESRESEPEDTLVRQLDHFVGELQEEKRSARETGVGVKRGTSALRTALRVLQVIRAGGEAP